jgi:hypothetical protein
VADRAHIHVRLISLELFFGHLAFPQILSRSLFSSRSAN